MTGNDHLDAYLTDGGPSDTVEGWFQQLDRRMFAALGASKSRGDVLEIGVYLGKSTVLLGYLAKADERVWVVDVFEDPAEDNRQQAEHDRFYAGLTRQRFEENYLRFHDSLPKVIEATSNEALPSIASDSCRLIHIDGSHVFDVVRSDIAEACRVATPDALVVLDDVLSPHTPGVTAAAWEAVLNGRLVPIAQSEIKMYATLPGSKMLDMDVAAIVEPYGLRVVDVSPVLGRPVHEVRQQEPPARSIWRQRADRILPPALADTVRRRRRM